MAAGTLLAACGPRSDRAGAHQPGRERIKFSEEGGTVAIEVGDARRGFAHAGARYGPGIPAGGLDRVFERHYRASDAQQAGIRAAAGAGDLPPDPANARLHDPREQRRGGGALLSFTLPLARSGERPDTDAEVRRRASSASPR
jgi:K+-sensing histidine kinase KdpD